MVIQTHKRVIRNEVRGTLAALTRMIRSSRAHDIPAERMHADLAETAAHFEATTSAYLDHEDIAAGRSGTFSATDLLCWLEIARSAGVRHVPARIILTLTSDEMAAASGPVDPGGKVTMAADIAALSDAVLGAATHDEAAFAALHEQTKERLASAMDGVGDDEMVRYLQCGASNLKTIAGAGLAGPSSPATRFTPNLATGAGWIQTGNRRRIVADDARITRAAAQTPEGYRHHFVSRPWQASSRYLIGRDPNRENTPVAGFGAWPAEWRAFVCNGIVTGVSAYYFWAHKGTQDDALAALEVRNAAQTIVKAAIARGLRPGHYDCDRIGDMHADPDWPGHTADSTQAIARWLQSCPSNGFNATLDFIETEAGPVLLEGGPSTIPAGCGSGAHPLGFCAGLVSGRFAVPDTTGAVLKTPETMDAINHHQWASYDRGETVISWDEVERIAAGATT